ncbi:MAG: glycosyltransferase family 4 protein [bacterium]
MRIALLPRIDKKIYPETTSSRPLMVYNLAKGLVDLGHDVTTFTSKDAEISGKIEPVIDTAFENIPPAENPAYQKAAYTTVQIEELIKKSGEFDIIHNHVYPEFWPILAASRMQAPIITTIHNEILSHHNQAFSYFKDLPFVALSESQKKLGKDVNYVDIVYNGIEVERFEFNDKPEDYLLFFGRMKKYKDGHGNMIDPKGAIDAIKIAKETGEKLILAGNVEDPKYYKEEIEPHLSDKIKFIGPVSAVGPINHDQKVKLYKNAKAILSPINWDEPFGLVMAEAMACGTPTLSFNRGAAAEVIKDKETGYIVKDHKEMVEKIKDINKISRKVCRKRVEENFSIRNMAEGYERAYNKVIK